jgi:hypothetical protein
VVSAGPLMSLLVLPFARSTRLSGERRSSKVYKRLNWPGNEINSMTVSLWVKALKWEGGERQHLEILGTACVQAVLKVRFGNYLWVSIIHVIVRPD